MAREKEQNEEGQEDCFHAASQKGEMGQVAPLSHRQRLHPAGAYRASSLGSPPSPPLPSQSLRFQCNFQLTSMSIEQVGPPDCWPITGNHSAPQLSSQGEGGREGGNAREQARPAHRLRRGLGQGVRQPPGEAGCESSGWGSFWPQLPCDDRMVPQATKRKLGAEGHKEKTGVCVCVGG